MYVFLKWLNVILFTNLAAFLAALYTFGLVFFPAADIFPIMAVYCV